MSAHPEQITFVPDQRIDADTLENPQVDYTQLAMLRIIDSEKSAELTNSDLDLLIYIGRQGILLDALRATKDISERNVIHEQLEKLKTENSSSHEQSLAIRRSFTQL